MNNDLTIESFIARVLPSVNATTRVHEATAFAPSNIALIKYWGKRDNKLNLPVTDSLSISLANKGTTTSISINDKIDNYYLNDKALTPDSQFYKRLKIFLDLFRQPGMFFTVKTKNNIPTAAGLASSASGFAALVKALNTLFAWELPEQKLSLLARIGSGSACRSMWQGFVKWQAGQDKNGLDSFAKPIDNTLPKLRVGLIIIDSKTKPLSSRQAMELTVKTSETYKTWPKDTESTMTKMEQAIAAKDFNKIGEIAEQHALIMHETMAKASPSICYSNAETLAARDKIWQLRKTGLNVFFTQDAGPNLKLLFQDDITDEITTNFPQMEVVEVFT